MILGLKQTFKSMEQSSPEIRPCTYGQLIINEEYTTGKG